MTTPTPDIVEQLRDEADLCRNETATDIADLLDEAASCIVAMGSQFKAVKAELAAAQEARDQALAIARELSRLATCMDAIPQGSIGTQVHKLRLLEERIARETEFDNATRNA